MKNIVIIIGDVIPARGNLIFKHVPTGQCLQVKDEDYMSFVAIHMNTNALMATGMLATDNVLMELIDLLLDFIKAKLNLFFYSVTWLKSQSARKIVLIRTACFLTRPPVLSIINVGTIRPMNKSAVFHYCTMKSCMAVIGQKKFPGVKNIVSLKR